MTIEQAACLPRPFLAYHLTALLPALMDRCDSDPQSEPADEALRLAFCLVFNPHDAAGFARLSGLLEALSAP